MCDKRGIETATALLHALETAVSLTPQCLTKILTVLEGSAVTEPVASKMRKALLKGFSARRTAALPSPKPGESLRIVKSVVMS